MIHRSCPSRLLTSGIGIFFCLLFVGALTVRAQTIKEARERLLKADSIEETGFRLNKRELISVFHQLVASLPQSDPELATRLILKSAELVNADERQAKPKAFLRLSDGKSNFSAVSEYLEDQLETIEGLGVQIRCYRNDIQGHIPFSGTIRYASRFALFSHFLSEGGNYNTARAMDLLLADLRTVAGEGGFEYLAPHMFSFAYHIRPAQRVAMANWASEKSSDSDITISSIGDATLMGLALFQRAEGYHIDSNDIPREDELDARLLELLTDESISPTWRAGFSVLIGKSFLGKMSPALRIQCGRILTKVIADDLPLIGTEFSYAITAFLRGNEADGEWQEVGKNLLAAWELRTPRRTLLAKSSLRPSKYWIVPMTELVCRVGSDTQISLNFEKFKTSREAIHPGIWINLVKTGKYDLANQNFLKHAAVTTFRSDHFHQDTSFDQKLEAAIPGYLKTIPDKNDRILAELIFAAVSDPSIEKTNQATSDKHQRLREFAAKYKELPEWKTDKQARAFEICSISYGNPTLTKWLADNQIGLEKRIQQTTPRILPYWAARMEMHSAVEDLEQNVQFPIQMMWGRAVFEENNILSRRQGNLAEAVIDMIAGRLWYGCRERDVERLQRLLPFCRQILATVPENVFHSDVHRFAIRVVTAHALCNKMADWDQWWDGIDARRQRHLIGLLENSRSLISSVEGLLNPDNEAPGVAFKSALIRQRLIREILETEWVDSSYEGYSPLARATAGLMLDQRDLIDISESIARKAPRSGSSWREYFGVLADENHLSVALETIEDELSQIEDNPDLVQLLKVEKYQILNVLGQTDEANAVQEELIRQDLDLPREYRATVNQLKRR